MAERIPGLALSLAREEDDRISVALQARPSGVQRGPRVSSRARTLLRISFANR